jgi:hypothetical protein
MHAPLRYDVTALRRIATHCVVRISRSLARKSTSRSDDEQLFVVFSKIASFLRREATRRERERERERQIEKERRRNRERGEQME